MKFTLSLLLITGALSTLSNAAFTVTASGTFGLASGTDLPGLNGALFTITTVFEGLTYSSEGGFTAAAGTNALTTVNVSDASNSAFNGTFSHYTGSTAAHYYPNSSGAGLYGGASDGYYLYFDLGSTYYLGFALPATATSTGASVAPGGAIELPHFSNGAIQPNNDGYHVQFGVGTESGSAYYDVNNGTFTVVPEPSAVLLSGLGCLALLRRRR